MRTWPLLLFDLNFRRYRLPVLTVAIFSMCFPMGVFALPNSAATGIKIAVHQNLANSASCLFRLVCTATVDATTSSVPFAHFGLFFDNTYNISEIITSSQQPDHTFNTFTVFTDTDNNFSVDDVVTISGTGNSEFDGEKTISTIITSSSFMVDQFFLSHESATQGSVTGP